MSTLARLNLVLLGALLAGACNQHGGRVYAASQEPVVNNGIPPSRRSVTERSKRDAIDAGEPRPRRHPRLPDEDTSGEGFYEPIIDINVAAVGAKVVFRFRAREVSGEVYEPTVKSIELWKKGDKQLTCEFRSSGVRLSEWQYGAVLERFENISIRAGAAAEPQTAEVIFQAVIFNMINHHSVNKRYTVENRGAFFFNGA